MKKAPIPLNDEARITALEMMGILDTPPEERFDKITKNATEYFNVKIATISLIDRKREWFKSCVGLTEKEGPRDISFCGHAMLANEIFIVEDTLKDERFADNPYVTGYPFIRFYAGISLKDKRTKLPIGVFCIKDDKPREFSSEDINQFLIFGNQAEDELNRAPKK